MTAVERCEQPEKYKYRKTHIEKRSVIPRCGVYGMDIAGETSVGLRGTGERRIATGPSPPSYTQICFASSWKVLDVLVSDIQEHINQYLANS
jgi:hypothetical protein